MAKRAKNVPAVDVDALVTVFVTLAAFDSSETEPVSVQEMADELDAPHSENAFTLLETLADAELIEFERGKVWISREDVTETNAEDIAVNALNGFTPVAPVEPKKPTAKGQEYKERTAYNAAVAASQEPGGQHLHPMEDARPEEPFYSEGALKDLDTMAKGEAPVIPAETPVIAENGENVTIPVDFDDPSKGRRELDASKGERLISEEVITVKSYPQVNSTGETVWACCESSIGPVCAHRVTPKPERLPEIDGLDQFIDDETGDMVYESRIVKAGLALDEPSEIPERPAGVHPNTWDMAHTAITQTARDYWTKRAADQAEEFKINNGEPAPF